MEIKLGKYRHCRGKEYDVICVAKHSETLEALVVYRALYGEQQLWVRPLRMFKDTVIVEGIQKPRFEFIG